MPVGSLAVSLTFRAVASPGFVTVRLVAGGRANELHGRALEFHAARPVDDHAFGQIDVGTAVTAASTRIGLSCLTRRAVNSTSIVSSAGGERSQLVRHGLVVARVQGHQRQRDVFGRSVAAVGQLELAEFLLAEEHFPRAVEAHRQLGLLDFDQGLRRVLLEVPTHGQFERLAWRGMIFSVSFSLEWLPIRRSIQRQERAIGLCGNDLARACRGAGHFAPGSGRPSVTATSSAACSRCSATRPHTWPSLPTTIFCGSGSSPRCAAGPADP